MKIKMEKVWKVKSKAEKVTNKSLNFLEKTKEKYLKEVEKNLEQFSIIDKSYL